MFFFALQMAIKIPYKIHWAAAAMPIFTTIVVQSYCKPTVYTSDEVGFIYLAIKVFEASLWTKHFTFLKFQPKVSYCT
jgi:hypothetical protein